MSEKIKVRLTFTVLAVQSQGEALSAGAVERAGGVFTRLSTQSAGETPALIYIWKSRRGKVSLLIKHLSTQGDSRCFTKMKAIKGGVGHF